MVDIMKAGSILSQFSNFFFFASGLFNDLLVIRVCLTLANTFLLAVGLLGLPAWGQPLNQGRISVDVVMWAFVNIVVVHGSGVIRMYYDERHIDFDTKEEDMLWRYFYRHSGLSMAQFKAMILPFVNIMTFSNGDRIPCKDTFYIILDGLVKAEVIHQSKPHVKHKIKLNSGDMFSLVHIHLNYLPRKSFLSRSAFHAIAASDRVRAFAIPVVELRAMSVSPEAKDAWTALLIASLAEIAERMYVDDGKHNTPDCNDEILATQIHPLYNPLHPSEEPDPLLSGSTKGLTKPLGHLWKYMKLSIYMPWPCGKWPIGLRHRLRPPSDPDQDGVRDCLNTWKNDEVSSKNPERSSESAVGVRTQLLRDVESHM